MVEQGDDAAVLRRTNEPADRLHDPCHPRYDVGVLEAALEAILVVGLEPVLFEAQRRQAGSDHGDAPQHVARVVHSFREHSAGDRQ